MSLPKQLVEAMHADYMAGSSLNELARKYGRNRASVREVFVRRGLHVRPFKTPAQYPDGRIIPNVPKTEDEISAFVAAAVKISVPPELKLEWRQWPMARRMDFINRIRVKLKSPNDAPITPFSSNVQPFDYGTPRSREIEQLLNNGLNSRTKRIKIKPASQGVIFRDLLYFWSPKAGYQRWGKWTEAEGRPSLHHIIWEETHGRTVPPGHVVRFIDGNPNNHAPENLRLATRDEVARENQASGLLRKSRRITALLLKRQQTQDPSNANIHALKSRRR